MLLSLIGCASIECGVGTVESAGVCRPVSEPGGAETGADSGLEDLPDTGDTAKPDEGPIEVYLLAGQSNMDGYAFYPGLAPSEQVADPRVPLYWSGWGEFRDLQPASYGGAAYVGPEVTFGRTLADAGRRVVLVKHAVGGTDLANFWYPGSVPGDFTAGDGFVVLMDSVEAATEALDAAGEPWVWAGFVWMQGESDALDLSMAHAYEENLAGLLAAVREITGTPELPATIGMISTESAWTYSGIVRDAETAVGEADANVAIVETDDLPRNVLDVYHYDSVSNRVLGQRFARSILTGADIGAGDDAPVAAFTLGSGRADYDFTGTCGWEFTTASPIEVTDLGAYGSGYQTVSADVGLWDASGNLRVRANVPSWYDAPAVWRGSVWYVAIDPIVLEPGTYRLGMVSWEGDADRYLNDSSGSFAGGIGYSAAVYAEGYWLTYPSTAFESASMSFLGPDFLFVPG